MLRRALHAINAHFFAKNGGDSRMITSKAVHNLSLHERDMAWRLRISSAHIPLSIYNEDDLHRRYRWHHQPTFWNFLPNSCGVGVDDSEQHNVTTQFLRGSISMASDE